MDKTYCEEVIISTVRRRGSGKDQLNVMRVVTEVFKKSGEKIAENDSSIRFEANDLIHFAMWYKQCAEGLTNVMAFERWIKETNKEEITPTWTGDI